MFNQTDQIKKKRKIRVGHVVSNRMEKTIVVEVRRRIRHPLYGKVITKRTKLYAHTPNTTYQIGDKVSIQETRPLSKLKRWRVIGIVEN